MKVVIAIFVVAAVLALVFKQAFNNAEHMSQKIHNRLEQIE